MYVVAFPGQPDPATGATTPAAVERFIGSITAVTTRAGYTETLTRLTVMVG